MSRLQLSSDQYQFETEKGRECYVIGRLAECDFIVKEASVSRVHAEVFWRPAGWCVRDVDSRHGIRINGASTKMGRLKDGDTLQLGDLYLDVKLIRESPISSARMQQAAATAEPESEPERPLIKIHGMGKVTSIMSGVHHDESDA